MHRAVDVAGWVGHFGNFHAVGGVTGRLAGTRVHAPDGAQELDFDTRSLHAFITEMLEAAVLPR